MNLYKLFSPDKHFTVNLFHIFYWIFQNAANPQQCKQLSAQNRSNFPKIEPNRLCAWIKDHKLGSPWRSTSELGKGETFIYLFIFRKSPSKMQLFWFSKYPATVWGTIRASGKGPWPCVLCLIPWEAQPQLRFTQRPLSPTLDRNIFMNQWLI